MEQIIATKYLSLQDVSQRYAISIAELYRQINRGLLIAEKRNRKTIIAFEEAERWDAATRDAWLPQLERYTGATGVPAGLTNPRGMKIHQNQSPEA